MNDISVKIEEALKVDTLNIPEMDNAWVMPHYDGLSIMNLPWSICGFLNVPIFGESPMDPWVTKSLSEPYEKVVLLLVDAMGYGLFKRLIDSNSDLLWAKYADRAINLPITSVCPSTTASALTSFWTGLGPASHGIIGYEMWAKEYGMVINNILHSSASMRGDIGGLRRAGFIPKAFMNQPVFGEHLADQGISSTAYLHASIANSGLSTMQMAGVRVQPFFDEADLCITLADHLNSRPGVKEFVYIYYSDVDTLMHRFTADDIRVEMQFNAFSSLFESGFIYRLTKSASKDTLLILTADHGAKNTPFYKHYELANHPKLKDCLVMQPTCENRLAFLYIKPGRVGDVRDYFQKAWPGQFALLEPELVLEKGLFGSAPFDPRTRERLGDLIAIAKYDAYLWWAPKQNLMAGRHGGLSSDEMLVPFFALPLAEITE